VNRIMNSTLSELEGGGLFFLGSHLEMELSNYIGARDGSNKNEEGVEKYKEDEYAAKQLKLEIKDKIGDLFSSLRDIASLRSQFSDYRYYSSLFPIIILHLSVTFCKICYLLLHSIRDLVTPSKAGGTYQSMVSQLASHLFDDKKKGKELIDLKRVSTSSIGSILKSSFRYSHSHILRPFFTNSHILPHSIVDLDLDWQQNQGLQIII
jgi:hypothetical protein